MKSERSLAASVLSIAWRNSAIQLRMQMKWDAADVEWHWCGVAVGVPLTTTELNDISNTDSPDFESANDCFSNSPDSTQIDIISGTSHAKWIPQTSFVTKSLHPVVN